MTWTSEADRQLLLLGLGRDIVPSEYAAIAAMFGPGATARAVQERLCKLKRQQAAMLEAMALMARSSAGNVPPRKAAEETDGVEDGWEMVLPVRER
ncbi:uncharacterized protein LTR77_010094 [Saxophila tyrrhenica]|uniref:Uncharacterized protein n=1 Tax=Saxophila tyrrhenica TaxID=1690608 RepID=A0AAV9NXJ0_9PEZI|nr:hypothetical protein LTR77_010094 [Saxophila tyrrhenica]